MFAACDYVDADADVGATIVVIEYRMNFKTTASAPAQLWRIWQATPVARRPSTVDTTCGRAGHLGSDKESETKPEPATSTGKRFSLFIATPLIWQAGAQSRSPASTPSKYPFASQLHCPSFPHSLIYIHTNISIYLSPSIPTQSTTPFTSHVVAFLLPLHRVCE